MKRLILLHFIYFIVFNFCFLTFTSKPKSSLQIYVFYLYLNSSTDILSLHASLPPLLTTTITLYLPFWITHPPDNHSSPQMSGPKSIPHSLPRTRYWPLPQVPVPGGCHGGWGFHSQGCSVHSSHGLPWGLPLSAAAGCHPRKTREEEGTEKEHVRRSSITKFDRL